MQLIRPHSVLADLSQVDLFTPPAAIPRRSFPAVSRNIHSSDQLRTDLLLILLDLPVSGSLTDRPQAVAVLILSQPITFLDKQPILTL
jgi:hypothetical protein